MCILKGDVIMSATERIPNAELDIMKVLWTAGAPIKASELTKALSEDRDWKRQTVHVLLSRLEAKGYVGVDKSAYSHLFYPLISQDRYLAMATSILSKKIGSSITSMMASLLEENELSSEEISALSQMLNAKCKEIK